MSAARRGVAKPPPLRASCDVVQCKMPCSARREWAVCVLCVCALSMVRGACTAHPNLNLPWWCNLSSVCVFLIVGSSSRLTSFGSWQVPARRTTPTCALLLASLGRARPHHYITLLWPLWPRCLYSWHRTFFVPWFFPRRVCMASPFVPYTRTATHACIVPTRQFHVVWSP